VLGSGDTVVENQLEEVKHNLSGYVNTYIGYNETLSHLMYAGADFLLMPSRVEPCGLNQMYALRYGTVPMVRSTGGLKDTVKDFGDWQGYGIRFNHASSSGHHSFRGPCDRPVLDQADLYNWMRSYMMRLNYSWDASADDTRASMSR
jgi:starch synthase